MLLKWNLPKVEALRSKVAAARQEETSNSHSKGGTGSKQVDDMVTKIEELTTIVKAASTIWGK